MARAAAASALPETSRTSRPGSCRTGHRFTRASFALKALEYLAAGRRVVRTALPALQWLDTGFVTTAVGATDFAEAVRRSLDTPLTADEVLARRQFAAGHTWPQRARVFAEASGLVPVSGARA